MIQIDEKYREILLEAIEERLYQISLRLESLKGGPMTRERKVLTGKQKLLEQVQHKMFSDL